MYVTAMRNPQPGRRVFSADDFRIWLDDLSKQIFGITGDEFLMAYNAGRFAGMPVASYLASVAPLLDQTVS